MTRITCKSFVKQVLCRDLGLCRCCGFTGHEVHHIIPLGCGGTDNISNMVTLCSKCHLHAPNSKEAFLLYAKAGGETLPWLLGLGLSDLNNNFDFNTKFILCKKFIKMLQETCYNYGIEKYNIKDSILIHDII